MRICKVTAPVTDLDAAERFYGYVLNATPARAGAQLAFDVGGAAFVCVSVEKDDPDQPFRPNRDPIHIAVANLESAYAVCRAAGARFPRKRHPRLGPLGEIADRPNGERSFYALDPFANPLCFVAEPAGGGPAPTPSAQEGE